MKEGISIKEIESILKMLNLRAPDIIRTSDAKLKEMKINPHASSHGQSRRPLLLDLLPFKQV